MLSVLAPAFRRAVVPSTVRTFASTRVARSGTHEDETFEQFTERYTTFFQNAGDLFEVQRGLNNCFSYDLVPAPKVIEAALRAARRVNDHSTAVRVFEGLHAKVENKKQFQEYLEELKPVRKELGQFILDDITSRKLTQYAIRSGISVKEELYSS